MSSGTRHAREGAAKAARPETKRPAPRAARRLIDPLLPLILLAALALRLWGVGVNVPDPRVADIPMDDTAVDEGDRRATQYAWDMWRGGNGPLNLNPGTGDWPGLPFYTTLAAQVAYRGYDLALHPGSTPASFQGRAVAHPAGVFLAGRIIGVLLGLASVLLIYVLGAQLGGRAVGRMAALFLAFLPFHVYSSQRVSDPNLLSLVFMTGAAIAMVRIARGGGWRDSILGGACVGLAAASKYVPGVLLAPLAFAHIGPAPKEGRALPVTVSWRRLGAAVAAAALAFALASPFTLLDWRHKQEDVNAQQVRLMTEWVGLSAGPRALPTYLVATLPSMLTWVGYLLALAGCVLLWRRGREGQAVLFIPILFVAAVGLLGLAQPRFVLPAVGVLAIAAALAVAAIGDAITKGAGTRARGGPPWIPIVAASAAIVWSLATVAATQADVAKPDARHVAYGVVTRSIAPNALLALDVYGPVLRRGPGARFALLWPFYASHSEFVSAGFHYEWLDGLRYYMTSSEVTRRFEGGDPRSAREHDFYRWIRENGAKVWASDPSTMSGPQIELYSLPHAISTPAARDSLWAAEAKARPPGERLIKWTSDLASDFLLAGDAPRAEEWAERGLSSGTSSVRQTLYETLSMARYQGGDRAGAERAAAAGSALYPQAPLLHVFRGMSLEALGRPGPAMEEYRLALPLTTRHEARAFVAAAIARLEARPSLARAGR